MDSLNLEQKDVVEVATYIDGDIALVEDFRNAKIKSMRLDNTLIVGFCIGGKGVIKLNNVEYNIAPNEMVICTPNVIISSGLLSLDFEGRLFIISSRVTEMISALSDLDIWNLLQLVQMQPIWKLSPETIHIFLLYYDLFKVHLAEPDEYQYHRKRLYAILKAFAYDLHQIMSPFMTADTCIGNKSQDNYLFNRFLKLLISSYPRSRKVAYYAEHLNTSAKYLSWTCKQQCGKTASEIINQNVIKDIKALLLDSRKSIKEIANELDFPNISFFGTYVRHHLGMSPKEFRLKNKKEEV